MAAWLAHHPFAVDAQLDRTTVLTFAAPITELQKLIPPCLSLDTLDNTWGFVAAALVQTQQLRPHGLPAWLGSSFFLIGYRVFVRYTTPAGKRLRGLYILRSETDKAAMQLLGNLFTSYHYHTIDVRQVVDDSCLMVESKRASLVIQLETAPEDAVLLPSGSPFTSWQQARRFAGPLPFTFSFQPRQQQVVIVEGVREAWHPQPLRVLQAQVGFLNQLNLPGLRLASAFTMTNIPYHWKKGRTEPWLTAENPPRVS
ncbi:hypothetical protein F0P96_01570 [Hymenobacter busanensis]|uniref:Uncharacterized protein n=1 Tax=Hymenobacter busanensis TaxID=2607656 RepID=A0A7L4ZV57_9BACT|nr:DUF2071 domain-containing protein [Hymenobacter busanensis]KAA9339341.1 hypothetical protein F0P96_01570 [Hymenobacter busanensis]QHJ06897.1 hypothetical protein GUY19_06180 [Hymenobacter busanensis]